MVFYKKNKELKFLEHESKNWIFEFLEKKKPQKNSAFLKNTIQRTELLFQYDSNFFSKYDSKNLTLHFTMTQFDFFFHDSQTWTFLFQYFFKKKNWLKELIFFFELWLSKCIFFLSTNATRRTDFFFFFQYDSQNWFFFWMWLFSWHWTFFWIRLKDLKFSNTTQRNNFFSLICLKV